MRTLSPRSPDLAEVISHLHSGDHVLLRLLAEHRVLSVLTTAQVAALFSLLRTCQHRLHQLRQLDLIDRIDLPLGAGPARLRPARRQRRTGQRPPPPATASASTTTRTLAHLVGASGFFIDLLGHARSHRHTALLRWWSKYQSTRRYAGIRPGRLQPAGRSLWRRHHHRVAGCWLEDDHGTQEPVPPGAVTRRLPAAGPQPRPDRPDPVLPTATRDLPAAPLAGRLT